MPTPGINPTGSAEFVGLVTDTHNLVAYYSLRPQLIWDALVELDNTPSTHNGSSHNWNFFPDMAVQATPLVEATDVTPVALTNTTRSVTWLEYGAAAYTTGFLRGTSYMEVNPIVWEIIGYNAGLSVDTVVRNRVESAAAITNGGVANTVYSDAGSVATGVEAARNQIDVADIFTANLIRYTTAKLRGASVRPFGTTYKGIIHPDAAYDLYAAAPNNNWADPHIHVDPDNIYTNVVGTFGGVMWMETPRASLFANASNGAGAAGTIDVYGTYICGHEALGKMYTTMDDYAMDPVFVQPPRIDNLQRFQVNGWKHGVGYSVFREESVWRVEHSSSIGANV